MLFEDTEAQLKGFWMLLGFDLVRYSQLELKDEMAEASAAQVLLEAGLGSAPRSFIQLLFLVALKTRRPKTLKKPPKAAWGEIVLPMFFSCGDTECKSVSMFVMFLPNRKGRVCLVRCCLRLGVPWCC